LALLLALFCARLWGLGLTHTDDAVWSLRAWDTRGNILDIEPVGEWARRQGRFWAFVSGALMLHAIKWNATAYGELLKLAGFAAFFAMFHLAVRAYCGMRIALLAATLNLAFAVVRWDGSIVTTYPLITWVAGIALCAGLVCGKRYVAGASRGWLVAAALLLFFSFMNNEGVTTAFFVLSVLAAWATRVASAERSKRFVAAVVVAGVAYGALYAGWRIAHPSQYAGHELGWHLKPFLVSLWHFSTGGSVLHDVIWPYKVTFAEPQAAVSHEQVYRVWSHWDEALRSPAAWIAAGVSGILVLRSARIAAGPMRSTVNALAAGLVIAFVALAPVALAAMYQGWVMEKGIRAYSHTPFAHFGWSLALAGLLAQVVGDAGRKRIVALVAAVVIAVLAALASATNDDIVDDMRPEAGRWRVLRDLLDANAAGAGGAGAKERTLLVPRFANGSWYVWVPYGFWWQYAYWRWGEEGTRVYTQVPSPPGSAGWAMVADYAWEGRMRGFTGLIARLHPQGSAPPNAKAVVWTEAHSLDGLVLVYPDAAKTVRAPIGRGTRNGQVTSVSIDLPDVDWVRLEREGGASPHPLIELDLRSGKVKNWTWPSGVRR
jgi:hypothetical protein